MIKDSKNIYSKTPSINGFLEYYIHTSIPARDSDVSITLDSKYEHAPDLLALDMYGDPQLWWIIPQRNGLQDPIFDMTTGTVLIAPSYETAKGII